jgi:hypothetical protein
MTFEQWQASKGIMPWPEVHRRAGQDLRWARAFRRIGHRMNRAGVGFAALGVAAGVAGIRAAHLAEILEHHVAQASEL